MKFFSVLIACIGMGVAGYFLHDHLIPLFLPLETQQASIQDSMVRTVTFLDRQGVQQTITLNLKKILPTTYPNSVTLNQDITLSSEDQSFQKTILSGDSVIPMNVENGLLLVKDLDSSFQGTIPLSSSDFEQQLALQLFNKQNP